MTGDLNTGGSSETQLDTSSSTSSTEITLSYPGSDLDLHVYDSLGRHVGVDYDTGLVDLEIPGSSYSGPAVFPEWIRLDQSGGQEYTVRVVGVSTIDEEHFSVTVTETPDQPAVTEASPLELSLQGQAGQTVISGFMIKEVAGQNPIQNLSLSATDLTSTDTGYTIQSSQIHWQIPVTEIPAGSSTWVTLDISVPADTPPAAYTGSINITSSSGSIIVPLQLDAGFSVELNAGWCLISFPLQPYVTDPGEVFASIDGKYDSVWAYDPFLGWSIYAPGGSSDLQEIMAGKGYWIKMNEPGTLTVQGSAPISTAITLTGEKWNMVGYSDTEPRNVEDCMQQVEDSIDSVWEYNLITGWSVYVPGGVSDLITLKPWYGYWIKADETCIWNINP